LLNLPSVILVLIFVNTLASSCFRRFSEKKRLHARGFAREYFRSCTGYEPGWSVKRRGKTALKKKFFVWGMRVFCEWRHKWKTFRPTWPNLPGPGHQPLGVSISMKFLLETRL